MTKSSQSKRATSQRKHPRYNVAHFEGLEVQLNLHCDEKLVSLGQGGCGFYTMKESEALMPPKRIYCRLRFEGLSDEPLEIQGNLLYCRPYEVAGKKVYYYGVEFLQAFQNRLDGMAKKLEELAGDGFVFEI